MIIRQDCLQDTTQIKENKTRKTETCDNIAIKRKYTQI